MEIKCKFMITQNFYRIFLTCILNNGSMKNILKIQLNMRENRNDHKNNVHIEKRICIINTKE